MTLSNGQTVFLAAAFTGMSQSPMSIVTQATVIDSENKILKATTSGTLYVLDAFSSWTTHESERAAWADVAARHAARASEFEAASREALTRSIA